MTEEKLAELLDDVLEKHALKLKAEAEYDQVHVEHHVFIQAMIEREKRRSRLFEKVESQILGWGAVAIAGAIGTVLLRAIKSYLNS